MIGLSVDNCNTHEVLRRQADWKGLFGATGSRMVAETKRVNPCLT